MIKPRTIVILGAGFGGVYAYKRLRDLIDRRAVRIVIINRGNHFLFSPLLHEVATGGLGVTNAVQGIREIIDKDCAELVQAEAQSIDLERRMVRTSMGDVYFDHLVIATGATTDYMGVPGAQEHTLPLKDLGDAMRLRSRLIHRFEEAGARGAIGENDGELGFVVVGGGPTGVEIAAEIADLFRYTFRRFFRGTIRSDQVKLTLVHAGERLLGQFHEKLSLKALDALREEGIRVILKTMVQKIDEGGITLSTGERILAQTVVWAAGVRAQVPPTLPEIPREKNGRLTVDEYFRVGDHQGVWAIGDAAAVADDKGGMVPMLAQAAVQEGQFVAENIIAALAGKPLKKFRYRSKGSLVSIGRWHAVGDVAFIRWSGKFAWWLWRTVYLFNFPSWPKRVRIAVDWTVNLFHPRDITTT
jgi:NADH:ubiquinone reductase (H+-translocating)